MCAHQSPHLVQRLILTNEANPKIHSTYQVENTNRSNGKFSNILLLQQIEKINSFNFFNISGIAKYFL
jgi:hypothetical protein